MAGERNMAWHRRAERIAAEGIAVVAAGFPCQDISYAGDGAGLAGARSGLVWSLLRTIRLVRPRKAVLENVSALLSRGLDQILGHMAAVGYDAEWHCIPASAVGASHQRDRIWIIASDANQYEHESDSAPISGQIADELSRASANSYHQWQLQQEGCEQDEWRRPSNMGEEVADTSCSRLQGPGNVSGSQRGGPATGQLVFGSGLDGRQWSAEPAVGRVADGVPARVDRLKALGNAVVPQIPEIIGRAIIAAETN